MGAGHKDRRTLTLGLEDTEDLRAGHRLDLGDTVGVAKSDADLRRGETLLGHLGDLVDHLPRGDLKPRRRGPPVRLRRAGNTLPLAVHAPHGDCQGNRAPLSAT